MSTIGTRRLIWVPIVHSQADLGSIGEQVRRLYLRQVGRGKWDEHLRTVESLWTGIRQTIDGLHLDLSTVRLYQDGLPCCGQEEKIVRDLAAAGSENHQLLLDLMQKGAKLTGTEAPELLLEEYELTKQWLMVLKTRNSGDVARRQRDLANHLLEKRDRYIAQRVADTLQVRETGLVFLGLLHSLASYLPPDIQPTRLEYGRSHGRTMAK